MVRRIAVVDREKCHPVKCGNYLCAKLCPVNRMGEECITPGDDKKARIDEKLCTGCGICPKRCPFGAITIINLPEQLEHDPMHRYGENLFALFSIPVPSMGRVVGIVGKNGVGKSTALKILTGTLHPNMGNWKNPSATSAEFMKFIKGTEAQRYFETLKEGKVRLSYKPQNIEKIPEVISGKVEDLLKKSDQTGKYEQVVQQLGLSHLLESEIKELSGGELQRVAIAAAALKDANMFFLDEPTSFLDIKQRIRTSKFIRSLLHENSCVMVVEHDLILLDYMSDLIHVVYGEESVFGVASGVKATREGINAFLEGFLKEENMRFRPYKISFDYTRQSEAKRGGTICSWEGLVKRQGKFTLQAHKGALYLGEVVGILGENGIGKSTFMKILAGVTQPDEGSISGDVTLSYKPQFLASSSTDLVMVTLCDAIKDHLHELVHPLGLEPLFQKQLCELSGGELQRVAIAQALSKRADLYLLDEPSAYLDVEQRLIVAKIIREFAQRGISVLVVDHDLLFLDAVSHRLLVCEGEPARRGELHGPFSMEEGMNHFLRDMGTTFRRDQQTHRPRANKEGSVLDREQRKTGKYYYS